MNRLLVATLAGSLLVLSACKSTSESEAPPPADPFAMDKDANATLPADPAYYKVPSNTLGPVFSGGGVTFNYWNANATSVSLCVYTNWNDPVTSPVDTRPMTRGAGGVWSTAALALPLAGNYYVYKVGSTYVLDPYAKSMAQWVHANGAFINGDSTGKGAILDPSTLGPDGSWSNYGSTGTPYFDGSAMKGMDGTSAAPYAFASNRDAIVYEAGVRDLTVDPNLGTALGAPWNTTFGTFKGLVQMLPHIQKLGVTHVQLLSPLANYTYDQTKSRTRELGTAQTVGANYNWGYDPHNYFTPSGMYSAAPNDPSARVNELKTLVNEIHKQGMGVILDVVYNHTANNAVLADGGMQGYWYRASSTNGAGSNDVRTEAKMVRKLLVDSIRYWVKDCKVDGFRFDLMGVLDIQTVKAAYAAAHDLNPKVVFLGEGWNGYYTGPATDYNGDATAGSDQGHSASFYGQNIAMFSDSYRNVFKNGYPADGAPAFLTGSPQPVATLFSNVAGIPTNTTPPFAPGSTNNVVSYLTCHDNLCLYDVIALAANLRNTVNGDAEILKRARIGYAALLTSQGLAFIHAGDEMFRTKESSGPGSNTKTNPTTGRIFVDNSYNASDAINMVRWNPASSANAPYAGDPIAGHFANYAPASNGYLLYSYVQGLIALRKSTNAFRLPDASLAANLTLLPVFGAPASALSFGYKAVSTDGTGTYYVFHNAETGTKVFDLTEDLSGTVVVADGLSAGTTAIGSPTGVAISGSSVSLAGLTSAVIKK